jgi:chemosensory pili system protein ChpC
MNAQKIKCILLTLRTENVVLPNAAVTEIVSLREIKKVSNAPQWLLGKIHWRGIDIPLVSFEAAAEGAGAAMTANQAAVIHLINSDGESSAYPYVGLSISGVPHISDFSRAQVATDTQIKKPHPMVAQRIRINGAAASILDIDSIASMIKKAAL